MSRETRPSQLPAPPVLGRDAEALKHDLLRHLQFTLGELRGHVDSDWEPYLALALAVRDRLIESWVNTHEAYYNRDAKRIYYMSLEFLMGRTLGNSMINAGLLDACKKAVTDLGFDLEDLREAEWDAGLGNGGLGRLAACFLDSMATLELPAYGYGIRYEYGIFHQRIVDGAQVETPDAWLRYGNPWEIPRPGDRFRVQFGGRVEEYFGEGGRGMRRWVDSEDVLAVPYDTPIPGYRNGTVNTLRLWSAQSSEEFNLRFFDAGQYLRAVEDKARSENISKVLYPNDNVREGKELRIKQEYFFCAATLQDVIRRHKTQHGMHAGKKGVSVFSTFAEKNAIQLNDTHPALAIPELMRLLVDTEGLDWDEAWTITKGTFGYTNHTVMPEALEKWPVEILGRVLPRHLEIIYEINRRFLEEVRARFGDDGERCARMSIIEEGDQRRVRMATLAMVGSHSVNGVAALHSDILKRDVFREFYEFWPEKFNNKTNGVTQRRWLLKSNPKLSNLITDAIGDKWTTDLYELKKLAPFANDAAFGEKWRAVKQANKEKLSSIIEAQYKRRGLPVEINSRSLFDCQIKRMHEYKRQLLNVLHVITLYNRIRNNPKTDFTPRTVIFGGKSAPGYYMAKLIIQLINSVGNVVNQDPAVRNLLKVVFLADYRVSLAEKIFPASDLSEQVSTAGTEASGTGNMKFALNGALTIGTMDGANVEIREEVGDDNIFIFGLLTEEVNALKNHYNPWDYYHQNHELAAVLETLAGDTFSKGAPGQFGAIYKSLLDGGDHYMLLADYASYIATQERVATLYKDPIAWTRKSILNVSAMGKFSSDRTIAQYASEIWNAKPVRP